MRLEPWDGSTKKKDYKSRSCNPRWWLRVKHVKQFSVTRPTMVGACSGPIRSEPVLNGFGKFPPSLNLEPDRRSGSIKAPNLGPDHGPVRPSSGSNQGSEPNLSIPILQCQHDTRKLIWEKAKELWPHSQQRWPEITIGTIMGIGSVALIRKSQSVLFGLIRSCPRQISNFETFLIKEVHFLGQEHLRPLRDHFDEVHFLGQER
jgi:hypothetical protein